VTSAARAGRPVLAAAVAVAVVAAVAGLLLTGGAARPVLGDPGTAVRWGLPLARLLHDGAAALAIGALLMCAALLPPSAPAWAQARSLALWSSVAWALAGLVVLVLGGAVAAGMAPSDPAFDAALGQYVSTLEAGRLTLLATVLTALVAVVAAQVRTPLGAGVAVLVALVALVPLALTGHAADAGGHELSVSSWWLHLVGVCVWAGGLVCLALLGGRGSGLGKDLAAVARRYSVVAGWAFVLVAFSGVANASVRIGGLADLGTAYGALLVVKVVALVLLGVAGWWHRARLLSALETATQAPRRVFWLLVGGEVVLMGLAMGAGVALSRSAPPVPEIALTEPTPAELVTGALLPPPLTVGSLFTQTTADVLWLAVAAAAVVSYLLGVRTLRARGDAWPVHRTLLWLLGCAVLVYVICGGVAVYGRTLFSVHMVQHMTLSMVVPPLLVFGAPVTLALRALPRRGDGSRGPREWLLGVVESRVLGVLGRPVVAAGLFMGSMVVFYYTPLFGLALRTHVGHELMLVHFLGAGYLFASGLVGIDPGPARPAYALRLLLLFATMGFHAFFGVAIMSSETLLEATYFSSLGWGIDALADQQDGGGIAWGIGELPTVLLAMVLVLQWSRSDSRESRRGDRAADRDGGADLADYNAMLARLGQRRP